MAFSVGSFSGEVIFGGAYYWRKFCVSEGLDNNNSLTDYEKRLKQLKTVSTNTPWAYIWVGVLSEGHLRLRYLRLRFRCIRTFFFESGA